LEECSKLDDFGRSLSSACPIQQHSLDVPSKLGNFSFDSADQPDTIQQLSSDVPSKPGAFDLSSSWQLGDFGYELGSSFDQLPSGLELPACLTGAAGGSRAELAERFGEKASPPPLPTDTFFKLATTSLHLSAKPVYLGNVLLDFLQAMFFCTDLKLNPSKFSIKAAILGGSSTCSVKLRLYAVEQGLYAVELQRRKGDCVLFMEVFRRLADHLRRDPLCSLAAGSILPEEPVAAAKAAAFAKSALQELEGQDLSALLDMAACTGSSGGSGGVGQAAAALPAEVLEDVAVALANVARDSRSANLLCTDRGAQALASLLRDGP
jgi:hypothetical protein